MATFDACGESFALAQQSEGRSAWAEGLERAAAGALLCAATPVIAAAAAAVYTMSRRAPFIAHLRVGQGGRPLWVLKLRTMWDGECGERTPGALVERVKAAPADGEKQPGDPRVAGRFAAFCRKHSLDELPQLWNVLRGEMSLVGPRPLTRDELSRYYGANAAAVLAVKPGMTGIWQTHGRSAVGWSERVLLDVTAARDRSWKTYALTLLKTIPAVIGGEGAW